MNLASGLGQAQSLGSALSSAERSFLATTCWSAAVSHAARCFGLQAALTTIRVAMAIDLSGLKLCLPIEMLRRRGLRA